MKSSNNSFSGISKIKITTFLFFVLFLSNFSSGMPDNQMMAVGNDGGNILIENGTYYYGTFRIGYHDNLTIINATVHINKILPAGGYINKLLVINSTLIINNTCDWIDEVLINNSFVVINQSSRYELNIGEMNVFKSSFKSENKLYLSIKNRAIIKNSLLENMSGKYWPCGSRDSTLVIQDSNIKNTNIDYQPCEFLNSSLIIKNSIFTNSEISYNELDYMIIKNSRFINTTLFGSVSLRGSNNVYFKFINNTLISDFRRSCFLSISLFFGDDKQNVNKIISHKWMHLIIRNNIFLLRKGGVGFFIEVFPIIRSISPEEIMNYSWELSKFTDYNILYNKGYPPIKVAIYYFCLVSVIDKDSGKSLTENAQINIVPLNNRSIPNATIRELNYQWDLLAYYEANSTLEKMGPYKITVKTDDYFQKSGYLNATNSFYTIIYVSKNSNYLYVVLITILILAVLGAGMWIWKLKKR